MTEEWREVPGFEGRYEVSNLGSVRSLTRRITTWWRSYTLNGRVLRASPSRDGYPTVMLGANSPPTGVHLLVLRAFVGPPPPGLQCRHLDCNRTNNKLSNLCWGTPKENGEDKARHGTGAGERNASAKLNVEAVKVIGSCLRRGVTISLLARLHGVCPRTVRDIKYERKWREPTGLSLAASRAGKRPTMTA